MLKILIMVNQTYRSIHDRFIQRNYSRNIYHKGDNDSHQIINYPTASSLSETIIIPLTIFLFICLVIFLLKLKCAQRKINKTQQENTELLIPRDTPIDLRFKCFIGSGSFGVVWKAELDNESIVAVKLCSVDRKDKWQQERKILASGNLIHPNIIKMVDWEVRKIKGQTALLLLFEFMERGDLRSYLMYNTLSLGTVLSFIRSLCNGITYLHSYKDVHGSEKVPIAHRDLKSSNVLISSENGCVITDFGLAVLLNNSETASLIESKVQIGTPRYMSPEKLIGVIEQNEPCKSLCQMDVYATALVAYEIFSRCWFEVDFGEPRIHSPPEFELPFSDLVARCPSCDEMIDIIVRRNVRPYIKSPWQRNEIASRLVSIINKCWHADPDERLTSQEMLMQIEKLILKQTQKFSLTLNNKCDSLAHMDKSQISAVNDLNI